MKTAERQSDLFAQFFPVTCWGRISPGLVLGIIKARCEEEFSEDKVLEKAEQMKGIKLPEAES